MEGEIALVICARSRLIRAQTDRFTPGARARRRGMGTHRLRRAREAVLEAGAALGRLVGVSLDQVRHAVLWASAVHHLLRRVVRVRDVGPRDVAEVLAALQLPHRFTSLKSKPNRST